MATTTEYTPRTESQLREDAASQVGAEIAGEIAPYEGEQGSLAGRETTTLAGIGKMFGELQPLVSGSADYVSKSYDASRKAESDIFQQAGQRLNQLRQTRAQEAQRLSQEMGGPVALGEFTDSVDPSIRSFIPTAAGAQLHALAGAQAGVQESQSFAGKVFPALRTEQEANARNFFEEKIAEITKQIAAIKASSTGRINERANTLIQQEREYALQKAQQDLEKIKADHEWEATKRSLAQDQARINLAKKQYGLQEAGVTGTYRGRPTLESRQLSAQERQAAAKLGLSEAQYRLNVAKAQVSAQTAAANLELRQRENAMKLLDSATSGGDPVSVTQRHYLTQAQGALLVAKGDKSVHVVGSGKNAKYYVNEKNTVQPGTPTSDPQALYAMLLGANVPKAMALNLVRTKTGQTNWNPGQKPNYTRQQLQGMPINSLAGIAVQAGYKKDPKHPHDTAWYIDWILAHQ